LPERNVTYTDALKTGFILIRKQWQLVVVQAVMMIVNCIGFFIIVGIPLGIAFVLFGLDLTGLASMKDILGMFEQPGVLIARYLWLVLLVVTSILFYMLVITTTGLFIFGGSVGMIGRGILDPSVKFSMRQFFSEARWMFFPLMWFSFFMGLVFLALAFVLGLMGGGIAAVVTAAKSQDSTLALFIGIFFSLVLVVVAIAMLLGVLAVTVFGIAALFFKRGKSQKSFRDAVAFLWKRPEAFWLYALLFLGYILASFLLMLITYPFHLIPLIGSIVSFPLQIISYVAQGYLGLVVLAVVLAYYYEAEIKRGEGEPKIPAGPTAGDSTSPEDISLTQAPGQDESPSEPAEPGEN
jgi:hypothetical protein